MKSATTTKGTKRKPLAAELQFQQEVLMTSALIKLKKDGVTQIIFQLVNGSKGPDRRKYSLNAYYLETDGTFVPIAGLFFTPNPRPDTKINPEKGANSLGNLLWKIVDLDPKDLAAYKYCILMPEPYPGNKQYIQYNAYYSKLADGLIDGNTLLAVPRANPCPPARTQ
jgi:hypothetical protein